MHEWHAQWPRGSAFNIKVEVRGAGKGQSVPPPPLPSFSPFQATDRQAPASRCISLIWREEKTGNRIVQAVCFNSTINHEHIIAERRCAHNGGTIVETRLLTRQSVK